MTNAMPSSGFHANSTGPPTAPAEPAEPAAAGEPAPALTSVANPAGQDASAELDADVYRRLLEIIGGHIPVHEVLTRVALLAAEVIPGAAEVSVTVVEAGKAMTVAFSGHLAPALDERQYEAGAGPCVHAALSGQMISIDDTATDTLYPDFSRQAHRHGVKYVLAIGLTSIHGTNGAINYYGLDSAGPFLPVTRSIATVFADAAGIAVMNALLLARTSNEAVQMREAMASRACIEQAKGIIMAQMQCSDTESFEILRTESMRSNRKLRDVAKDMVEGIAQQSP